MGGNGGDVGERGEMKERERSRVREGEGVEREREREKSAKPWCGGECSGCGR